MNIMKTSSTSKYLILFFITVLIISCGKDDDSPTPEPTVEELLTNTGRWYIESITGESMDNCDKTTYWEFSGNRLIEQWFGTDTEGNCAAGYLGQFTYDLVSETQLNLSDGTITEVTIESISETQLKVSYPNGDVIVFDKNPGSE